MRKALPLIAVATLTGAVLAGCSLGPDNSEAPPLTNQQKTDAAAAAGSLLTEAAKVDHAAIAAAAAPSGQAVEAANAQAAPVLARLAPSVTALIDGAYVDPSLTASWLSGLDAETAGATYAVDAAQVVDEEGSALIPVKAVTVTIPGQSPSMLATNGVYALQMDDESGTWKAISLAPAPDAETRIALRDAIQITRAVN